MVQTLQKKRCSHTEERSACVRELKSKLQQHHKSAYSAVKYTLWAEMLVGETHDSLDNPPEVPTFGGKRTRGRSSTCGSDLNAALTGMANSTVTALSPQVSVQPICSGTKQ